MSMPPNPTGFEIDTVVVGATGVPDNWAPKPVNVGNVDVVDVGAALPNPVRPPPNDSPPVVVVVAPPTDVLVPPNAKPVVAVVAVLAVGAPKPKLGALEVAVGAPKVKVGPVVFGPNCNPPGWG